MKQERFQLLCAVMLGFGQLFFMIGYDSESFILESVIHSVHEREPNTISPCAGYYGQAVIYFSYTVASFFAPSLLTIMSAKMMLILSAVSYVIFSVGFLFINSYFFYFSGALLGAGTALFFISQGSYLISHSTRQTIESNVSTSWSVGCCCLLVGSVIFGGIIKFNASESPLEHLSMNGTSSLMNDHYQGRVFSDLEIKLLFSAISGMSILAVITFILLPSKDVDNCIESSEKQGSFMGATELTCSTVISPKMLQILPLTIFGGFNVSFWLSILPTALNFTKHNSNLIYIPAIWSLGAGVGEVLTGALISTLSKRIKGFGLKPTMVISTVSVIIYCGLVHASTPFEAPLRPTSEEPLVFYHSYPLIFLIAFAAGVSDCCINGVRSVICALVLPERRIQSFSVARMYHAGACTICFIISPSAPLYFYTIGLPVLSVIATFTFFRVANSTKAMERKLTQISMEKNQHREMKV